MNLEHDHNTLKVIVCSHVAEQGLPVREVIHARAGDWQFLCGGDEHRDSSTARIACWFCMMGEDASLAAIEDLEFGAWAERSGGDAAWRFYWLEDENT